MSTLQALALVALTVWVAPLALIFAWVLRDRSHDEPVREGATAEWLAELAPERPVARRPDLRRRVAGVRRARADRRAARRADGEVVLMDTRVAAARTARDESMQAASDAADVRLVLAVDKVIAEAIASGEPFSSNTIRDRMPTVRPGLIGSRIKAASMRNEPRLVRVGEEPSTLRSTHAKPVAVWQVQA